MLFIFLLVFVFLWNFPAEGVIRVIDRAIDLLHTSDVLLLRRAPLRGSAGYYRICLWLIRVTGNGHPFFALLLLDRRTKFYRVYRLSSVCFRQWALCAKAGDSRACWSVRRMTGMRLGFRMTDNTNADETAFNWFTGKIHLVASCWLKNKKPKACLPDAWPKATVGISFG
jgi:hypothetical protein